MRDQDVRGAGIGDIAHEKEPRPGLTARGGSGVGSGDGRAWFADLVLVAAGAWTPEVLPHLQNVMWTTAQTVFHFQPTQPERFRAPAFPVWGADIARTGSGY